MIVPNETINLSMYGEDFELGIEVQKYTYGGGLALFLHCMENGEPVEPFADITKNLAGYPTSGFKAFVDTNNFPQVTELISEFDLGKLTGRVGCSGFCTYPEIDFNMKNIEKYVLNKDVFDKIMSERSGVER